MITLLEIAELLAKKLDNANVYAGCINASQERQYGVYIRSPSVPKQCIGGKSSYQTEKVRILIHWTDSPNDTQKKAQELNYLLENLRNELTGKHVIKWIEPKGVHLIGKDEKGICEAVADADIIYSNKED